VFARSTTTIDDFNSGLTALLRLVASSVTRVQAGPDRRQLLPPCPDASPGLCSPSTHEGRWSPPAPVCQHRLWCRSRRFSRPQRLAPPPTAPGLSPGNARGVLAFKGFPCRGSVAVAGSRPLLALAHRSPCGARCARLQGFVPRGSPSPPPRRIDAPGLDPFLAFLSSRVSSRCRPPLARVILPRSLPSHLRGRSRYLCARSTLGVLTATRPDGSLYPPSLMEFSPR
jgi:hypothetical protein